jgi:predicted hotdog family 3-hydroxylacyl-ACP dehydratase
MTERFDPQLFELIPHREPMLLINKVLEVNDSSSEALVLIDQETPFFEQKQGVASWIGLEYMGQASALIAGHQLKQGNIEPHLGFLMGSRKYQTQVAYFKPEQTLIVRCNEAALVGDSLATFNCCISDQTTGQELATAILSVFRRPL